MQDDHAISRSRTAWLSVAGLAGLSILAAVLRRRRKLAKISPDLRSAALATMPSLPSPFMPVMRYATRMMASRAAVPPGVEMSEHWLLGSASGVHVRVLSLKRSRSRGGGPALLWLHGGGYVIGTPELDLQLLARILQGVDIAIYSVDYRLAPQNPFPAALDDAMTVLRWLTAEGAKFGIDPQNIAVGGNSAGGGLAAALAQRACDESIPLTFQLLMYPMLDDRTACRANHGGRGELVWTPSNNRYGWASYLGHAPGTEQRPLPYAVPARREKLVELPPAWIGVGSLDLFYEENREYTERLRAAGVVCALDVVADAPHAFDLFNFGSERVRAFHDRMIASLISAYGRRAAGRTVVGRKDRRIDP